MHPKEVASKNLTATKKGWHLPVCFLHNWAAGSAVTGDNDVTADTNALAEAVAQGPCNKVILHILREAERCQNHVEEGLGAYEEGVEDLLQEFMTVGIKMEWHGLPAQ